MRPYTNYYPHNKFDNCFINATIDDDGVTHLEIHMEWDGQIFHEPYGIRTSTPNAFGLPAICRAIEKTFARWRRYAEINKEYIPVQPPDWRIDD